MAQATELPDVTTRTDSSIICPTLHHYGIVTDQPDELVDWYAKVVGMEINLMSTTPFGKGGPSGPKGIWVSNDGTHHRIAVIAPPGVQKLENPGQYVRVQHSAWEFNSIAELMDSYERIRDLGIRPVVCVDHGPSVAFYYKDPDNNTVELLADAFGDWRRSREFLRTQQCMRDNPMGSYVDPDRMLEAYRQGASDDELHERAFGGEFIPDPLPDPRQLV